MRSSGFSGRSEENQTRSGIAVSQDRVHWRHYCWATPKEVDDRDVILFPETVGGRYAMLRRPLQFVSPDHSTVQAIDVPGIWITFSEDLQTWSEPVRIAVPEQAWVRSISTMACATRRSRWPPHRWMPWSSASCGIVRCSTDRRLAHRRSRRPQPSIHLPGGLHFCRILQQSRTKVALRAIGQHGGDAVAPIVHVQRGKDVGSRRGADQQPLFA